jgi:hypothetical protein
MLGTMADQQHQPCSPLAALWRTSLRYVDGWFPTVHPRFLKRIAQLTVFISALTSCIFLVKGIEFIVFGDPAHAALLGAMTGGESPNLKEINFETRDVGNRLRFTIRDQASLDYLSRCMRTSATARTAPAPAINPANQISVSITFEGKDPVETRAFVDRDGNSMSLAVWRSFWSDPEYLDLTLPNPKPPEIDRLMRLMLPEKSESVGSKSPAVN